MKGYCVRPRYDIIINIYDDDVDEEIDGFLGCTYPPIDL